MVSKAWWIKSLTHLPYPASSATTAPFPFHAFPAAWLASPSIADSHSELNAAVGDQVLDWVVGLEFVLDWNRLCYFRDLFFRVFQGQSTCSTT